ncbi:DUF4388 domain-containing protein [Deinococcus sp. QL22]|uniref:DUF4388 domain-containing protein n=1 Tax=Deinococcus sp. QL22 TaxID=2939437 RepID=UPI0035301D2A
MTLSNDNRVINVFLVLRNASLLKQELRRYVPEAAKWHIVACNTINDAIHLLPLPHPDLIVLELTEIVQGEHPLFVHARDTWPMASFLAATFYCHEELKPLFLQYGDMSISSPNPHQLCSAIAYEVEHLSYGSLRGLSLPSLLQMLEWEAKSMAVRVESEKNWGRLHLNRGHLVDAYVHNHQSYGEMALLEILRWDNVSITLERSYRNEIDVIKQPLANLLMEAMKRRDETAKSGSIIPEDFILDDSADENVPSEENKEPQRTPMSPLALRAVNSLSPRPVVKKPSGSISDPKFLTTFMDIDAFHVKEVLNSISQTVDGVVTAALVDYQSGVALAVVGSGVNLDIAAAGDTEVLCAKMRTMESLGTPGAIEDIFMTLEHQYHIIYPVPGQKLFVYVVLHKEQSNLTMARYKLRALVQNLKT